MTMNNLQLLPVAILMLVFCSSISFSQVDSISIQDSSEVHDQLEQLLEQAPQEESSPILDVLSIEPEEISSSKIMFRSRMNQALQQSAGFSEGKYLGSPVKSYQRLNVVQGEHLSGGILFEKDAGEQRFNDFMSGNLTLSKIGSFAKVVLGDYLVESGQGIALWRGYDFSKGADVITPTKRITRELLPYVSSGESAFLRGAAAQVRVGKLSGIVFFSRRFLTASIDSNDRITAFSTSGYFRTLNELARRDNVNEQLIGMRSTYVLSTNNSMGVTAYMSDFSNALWLDGGRRFSGSRYSLVAID